MHQTETQLANKYLLFDYFECSEGAEKQNTLNINLIGIQQKFSLLRKVLERFNMNTKYPNLINVNTVNQR